MAKNIEPKLMKIGDYLRLEEDTIFIVPEYQRAYSWKTENCDKLWQDINDYMESDEKDCYFFGTIIISCQDDDTRFGLIDGQQRTTTFLLLLKALLLRINEAILTTKDDPESEPLCRGLQERRRRIMEILYRAEIEDIAISPHKEKDLELFKNDIILENYSINEKYKDELAIILRAYDFEEAKNSVKTIPYKQKDNKYTNYFRNFKFFYNKINELSESEVNKITKTITDNCEVIEIKSWKLEQAIKMFNSLNSDGLALYDSDIISAQLYAEAEKQGVQNKFAELWKEFNNCVIELEQDRIADINSILMQYMYFERRMETVNEKGSVNVTTPGLRRYFTEIHKELLQDPIGMCETMIKLAKMWKKISKYSTAQVLQKYNENSKLFLASYFLRFSEEEINEERIKPILEVFLRLFVILELVDVGYSSKLFKTFLFREEIKLADKSINEVEIIDDFDAHIRTNWDEKNLKESIEDYDGNILVYLNEYLLAKEKNNNFSIGSTCDIEHIMPSSGSNLQSIRKDAGMEDEGEFQEYVNKLGNKILLESKINRSIGNEWFRTKISSSLIDKTGYLDSKYPMATYLVTKYEDDSKPYWTKEDIVRETNKASDRIIEFIFGKGEYSVYKWVK